MTAVESRLAATLAKHDEEWRPVFGYEGLYEVSDRGQVRSLDRIAVRSDGVRRIVYGRIMIQSVCRGDHRQLRLSRDGKVRTFHVHRLVLEAFVGLRPDGTEACHNNGDPTDNRVENLRWDTRSENMRDAVAHGTNSNTRKTHCPAGHPYDESNTAWRGARGTHRECRTCRRDRDRVAKRCKRSAAKAAEGVARDGE